MPFFVEGMFICHSFGVYLEIWCVAGVLSISSGQTKDGGRVASVSCMYNMWIIQFICILESQVAECSMGSFYIHKDSRS